ncbi:MAG: efflux RND transporter periplasmic adaptor subunit [Smithellaceae bacterium]|nr:efflux RND transporter periplasmic adaptor subunit [Smithellaceae bacterium]
MNKSKMISMFKPLLWGAAVLAAAGLVLKMTLLAPVQVKTAKLERRDLSAQAYGNGTVEAKVVVGVSSKITGRIVAVYADQGDRVRKGQLLARLESDDFAQLQSQSEAGVEKADSAQKAEEATLNKAKAALVLAEANAVRYKALGDKELVARMEADQYATAAQLARAEVARAEAVLDSAGKEQRASRAGLGVAHSRMGDTRIYASQDGIVISRDLEAGATVTPGAPIFTIADPRVIWVKANVDEMALKGVAVGQKASIALRSAPAKPFTGRVARMAAASDRVTEELEVDVAFTPLPRSFHLGEQADVYIGIDARKDAPSLPSGAFVKGEKGRAVWMIREGRLASRPVTTGLEDRRGFTEVLSGVGDGDKVALAPPPVMATFREGMKVQPGK